MKNQTITSILVVLIVILSSCSASKKFDFADAYKFSHHRYQKTEQEKPEPIEEQTLTASVSEESVIIKNTNPSVTRENVTSPKTWTKEEKKVIRKEIKEEVKKVRSELKEIKKGNLSNTPDMQSKKATQAIDGKIYIGTVIALAGLILLILGVASSVGALAIVVGLVFIVWGLIQQGSF